jgi:uncharacterized protein (DUF111 family)
MLSSCAPGIVVVNIDNGYGAAVHAARVARQSHGVRPPVGSGQVLVEANVDDLDPRLWPGVLDALLAAGAVDAWLAPIHMKKGRPAHTVTALCDAAVVAAVGETLLAQTSTIGYRTTPVTKVAAPRTEVVVTVREQQIRVKVTPPHTANPEWDDVAAAADVLGIPARRVLAEAQAAALELS